MRATCYFAAIDDTVMHLVINNRENPSGTHTLRLAFDYRDLDAIITGNFIKGHEVEPTERTMVMNVTDAVPSEKPIDRPVRFYIARGDATTILSMTHAEFGELVLGKLGVSADVNTGTLDPG